MKFNLAGTVFFAGAVASLVAAYAGKPDASTCQVINNVSTQLGNAPACNANPVAWLMWVALALVLAAAFCWGAGRLLRA